VIVGRVGCGYETVPSGHNEFKTRLEAMQEVSDWERIKNLPFTVKAGEFHQSRTPHLWLKEAGKDPVMVRFGGYMAGGETAQVMPLDGLFKTGEWVTVKADDLSRPSEKEAAAAKAQEDAQWKAKKEADAKPVTATVTTEKAAEKLAGKPDNSPAKLKVQKAYLLEALDRSVDSALETLPKVEADADAELKRNSKDLSDLYEKYNIPTMSEERLGFLNDDPKRILLLDSAIRAARFAQLPKIVIEVPGDGIFSILNTKKAIKEFRETARKDFPTVASKAEAVRLPSIKETAIHAVGKPKTPKDFAAIAGTIASKDATRAVINNVLSDGENVVATDGRRAMIIKQDGGGTEEKPVMFTRKGEKVKEDVGQFPHWKHIVPANMKQQVKSVDTASLSKALIQASKLQTGEGDSTSVALWVDDKGKIGVTSSHEGGEYVGGDANPQKAILIGTFNGDFLLDGIKAARALGNEKVTIKYNDDTSPITITAPDYKYILMPERTATFSDLATKEYGSHPQFDTTTRESRTLDDGGEEVAPLTPFDVWKGWITEPLTETDKNKLGWLEDQFRKATIGRDATFKEILQDQISTRVGKYAARNGHLSGFGLDAVFKHSWADAEKLRANKLQTQPDESTFEGGNLAYEMERDDLEPSAQDAARSAYDSLANQKQPIGERTMAEIRQAEREERQAKALAGKVDMNKLKAEFVKGLTPEETKAAKTVLAILKNENQDLTDIYYDSLGRFLTEAGINITPEEYILAARENINQLVRSLTRTVPRTNDGQAGTVEGRDSRAESPEQSANRVAVEGAVAKEFGEEFKGRVSFLRTGTGTGTQSRVGGNWDARLNGNTIEVNLSKANPETIVDAIREELGHLIFRDPEMRPEFDALFNALTPTQQAKIRATVESLYSDVTPDIRREEILVKSIRRMAADGTKAQRSAWRRFVDWITAAWKRLTGKTPQKDLAEKILARGVREYMGGKAAEGVAESRTMDPFAAKDEAFRKEVAAIKTPEYGNTFELRLSSLDSFRNKWVERFRAPLIQNSVDVRVLGKDAQADDGRGVGSSSGPQENGRILITIGNLEMQEHARSKSELAARAFVASTIEEEIIHAIHLQQMLKEWDGTSDQYIFLAKKSGQTLQAAYDQLGHDRFTELFGNSTKTYFEKEGTREEVIREISKDPMNIVRSHAELVRQLVELKTRGHINETVMQQVLRAISDFAKEVLESLRSFLTSSKDKGSALFKEVSAVADTFEGMIRKASTDIRESRTETKSVDEKLMEMQENANKETPDPSDRKDPRAGNEDREPLENITPKPLTTRVMGQERPVMSKEEYNEKYKNAALEYAKSIFDKAGLRVVPFEFINSRKEQAVIWRLADDFTQEEEKGQKLLQLLKEAVVQEGSGLPDVAALIDSIRGPISKTEAFTQSLRSQLANVAQGVASKKGVGFRALNGIDKSIFVVASDVLTHLNQIYADKHNGALIDAIMGRLLTSFRDFFTDGELKNFSADNPKLTKLIDRLIRINEEESAGMVYRRVQAKIGKTKNTTAAKLASNAMVEEAANKLLEDAAALGIKFNDKDKPKLTAMEKLLLVITPENSAKIEALAVEAVRTAERKAGIEIELSRLTGEEKDTAARLYSEGVLDPSAEAVEEGLLLPEHQAWKVIRENLLGYSPITVKLSNDVIKGAFKGTRQGNPTPVKEDTRINLAKLATDPEAEVQRVMDAYFANLDSSLSVSGADPTTQARVSKMIRDEVAAQLVAARGRFVESYFAPKEAAKAITASERLQKLINSGADKDPRFKGEKVRKLLKAIASTYLKDTDFQALATQTRAEKQAWIASTLEQIATKEGFEASEQGDYLRSVVFGDLATRIGDAERAVTDSFLAGKAVSYDKVELTPEEKAKRLEEAKAKMIGDLTGKINARAFDVAMIPEIASKSAVHRLLPSIPEMVKDILATPFYRQEELKSRFAARLVEQFNVDPANADKVAAVFLSAFATKEQAARTAATKALIGKFLVEKKGEASIPVEKTPLWKIITDAVNAGVLDTPSILQTIAKANGARIPTPAEVAKMKSLSEQEQKLRELTPKQLEALGDNPSEEALAQAKRDREAATERQRYALKHEMGTMWTLFHDTIKGKSREAVTNRILAGKQIASANLIFTMGFGVKQLIDVGTQIALFTPSRAWAQARSDRQTDIAQGNKTQLASDFGHYLGEAYRNQSKALKFALATFKESMKGTIQARDVDGLFADITVFDRIERSADELVSKGGAVNIAKATAMRTVNLIRYSYRFAQALDMIGGNAVESQQVYEQAVHMLKQNTLLSTDEARKAASEIVGDFHIEWERALNLVTNLAAEQGVTLTDSQAQMDAWEVVKANQYARLKAQGINEDVKGEILRLKNVIGWNSAETAGPGGLVRALASLPLKYAPATTGWIGDVIPGTAGDTLSTLAGLAMASPSFFANAIGISVNRGLTFAGGGFVPGMFRDLDGNYSEWYKTPEDRSQRRFEATLGTTAIAFLFALAMQGLIRVRNKPPQDEEERKQWEREGHKANTVEFVIGDGKFIPVSTVAGPMQYARIGLAAIGAMQDATEAQDKKKAGMERKAKGRSIEFADLDAADYWNIALAAGYSAALGGRTATGAANAYQSQGSFIPTSVARGVVSSYVPMLPAFQQGTRLAGVSVDNKRANFLQLLFPLPGNAERKNVFGDKVGTQNAVQRISQQLTGGTYLGIVDSNATERHYMVVQKSGYVPSATSSVENAYHIIGGSYRKMTPAEIDSYRTFYGNELRNRFNTIPLNGTPDQIAKEAAKQDGRARENAKARVGIRTP